MRSVSSLPTRSRWPSWSRWSTLLLIPLLAFPLSGCLDGDGPGHSPPLLLASGLFTFEAVERGDTGATRFSDCSDLRSDLDRRALDQARIALDQSLQNDYWGWGWRGAVMEMSDDMAADSAVGAPAAGASASSSTGAPSAASAQVTGTNNQETAADEADLVKTDGEWTYVLSNGILHILHSDLVGDVEAVHSMELGQAWGGGELLLVPRGASTTDDRLVLVLPSPQAQGDQPFLTAATRDSMQYSPMTRVLVLSLADREDPEVMEDTWIEGHATGARLVDGHAYVTVQGYEGDLGLRTWVGPDEQDLKSLGMGWADYEALDEGSRRELREILALRIDRDNQRLLQDTTLGDHLPLVLRQQSDYLFPQPVDDCRDVWSPPQSTGRAVTTILALDVAGDLAQSTTQVLGGSPIVYADAGTLVLASPSQDTWWFWAQPQLEEATDLLWFDLDGLEVTQRASGRVLGHVLDSFSLDVRDDELRVATTVGTWSRWWLSDPVPMTSQLVVLKETAGLLVPTGSVGGLAPGERIWSARFTDDRAYIVTFRQTDPLWVIDLRGGEPSVLAELKIPGVSTYLHPVGDDLLLTIGYGPGPDGLNLDWGSVELSLYDMSDPSDPMRADVLKLTPPGGSSWSGATNEHRAFTYWDAIGKLAVPMTSTESYEVRRSGSEWGSEWVTEQHMGLMLVDVDTDHKWLSIHGQVDQDRFLGPNEWSNGIERSYFLGEPDGGPVSVYAISPHGVTAHDLETLQPQGWVAFPEVQSYGYGCCWEG